MNKTIIRVQNPLSTQIFGLFRQKNTFELAQLATAKVESNGWMGSTGDILLRHTCWAPAAVYAYKCASPLVLVPHRT